MDKGRNPTDLRALEAEKQSQRDKEMLEQAAELNDVKTLMSTPAGRRFMWRILEKAGVFRTSFTGNSTTFFNEGMRNIGLMFQAQVLEACPDQYIVMLMESKAKQEEK